MFEYDFDIDNKKKRKRNERTYLFIGQSGFCSVIDEDFNQTLTFQIEILSNFEYNHLYRQWSTTFISNKEKLLLILKTKKNLCSLRYQQS